jgi:deoxycytidylate deaminase
VHAEKNALDRADHIPLGSTLFCTDSPCGECALEILKHKGVRRLYYQIPYRDTGPVQWLLKAGMEVARVTPNGMAVDEQTKELVESISS